MILASAASAVYDTRRPGLARLLNPFNTEAKINWLAYRLAAKDIEDKSLTAWESQAKALVAQSPNDARTVSLLGEVYRRQGRQAEADAEFEKALALAPTELNALINRLRRALRENAIDEAITRLDLILLRWPGAFEAVKPLISALASNGNAAALLRTRLAARPSWRTVVMRQLVTTLPGAVLARQLLLDEQGNGEPLDVVELGSTISAMVNAKKPVEAYNLFLLTLDKKEQKLLGYIFNPEFKIPPDSRVFNWQLIQTSEADVSLPYSGSGPDGGGLAVRFRGVPAKLGNIYQTLVLPPGPFTISARVTAFSLAAPKGVYWEVTCIGGQGQRAVLNMEDGSYKAEIVSAAFTVPQTGCAQQLLILRTGTVAPTWRQRYEGTLLVHNISIVRK